MLKPFLPGAGVYGLGPWVTIEHDGERRSGLVVGREMPCHDGSMMIEEYTVRIITVTNDALRAATKNNGKLP